MKILFDFFPVLVFYAAFQFARANREWAATTATAWLGGIVSGGVVGMEEAPTVLATVAVVAATLLQIVWLMARRKPIPKLLWISLGLVTVFGGATVWFHSREFIQWKFTIFYWVMATSFLLGQVVWKTNFIQKMLGGEVQLPQPVWARLNLGWTAFFYAMGAINLYVAYQFSENVWYNFKLFGGIGLTLLFALAQGLFIAQHMQEKSS